MGWARSRLAGVLTAPSDAAAHNGGGRSTGAGTFAACTHRTNVVDRHGPSGSDVAFSAGFGSIRQCNDTIREVFAMTPTQLRAQSRTAATASGAIDLVLPVREPFDVQGCSAGWRSGVSREWNAPPPRHSHATSNCPAARHGSRSATMRRAGSGCAHVFPGWLISDDSSRGCADCSTSTPIRSPSIPHSSGHRELAPLVARTPGMRVPGAADPHGC